MNLSYLTLLTLLILLSLISPGSTAKSAPTSFCKCICFANSTIIALNAPPSSTAPSLHDLDIRSPSPQNSDSESDSSSEQDAQRPHRKLTCTDCTRAFCLDHDLPICKDAREEDVFTTCFQRDSLKDETVVVIFIFATAGLLAWAAVKPWVDKLRERNFVPLGQGQQNQDRGTSDAAGPGRQRSGKEPRRTQFRDGGAGSSSTNSRGGRPEDEGEPFTVGTYDEDMHADQDAEDIVSNIPSGSGYRPR